MHAIETPERRCATCERVEAAGFGPAHDPSPKCESGGYPHCTCRECFD